MVGYPPKPVPPIKLGVDAVRTGATVLATSGVEGLINPGETGLAPYPRY